jgi:hypothetical protein
MVCKIYEILEICKIYDIKQIFFYMFFFYYEKNNKVAVGLIGHVKKFMRNNSNIPEDYYGKWTEIIAFESSQHNNMQCEPHQQQTQCVQPQKTQQQKMQQQPQPEKIIN